MLMFCHLVIAWKTTWNWNNLSQVNCTLSYALETTVWLALYFIIDLLAYLDIEAFGADKGEEDGACDGFEDSDNEES